MRPMYLSAAVLGQSAVRAISERTSTAILVVGSDTFYRRDFAHVECFNFIAAANLSQILHDQVPVKNLRDLFDRIPPSALLLPRLGPISLAVLGAAFEIRGIGGDAPLEAWIQRHQSQPDARFVTFPTLKQHAARVERARIQARRKRRQRMVAGPRALAADV